jgi:hypothetical protein
MITITAKIIRRKSGKALFAIKPISLFAMPWSTNKLNPTGGVI